MIRWTLYDPIEEEIYTFFPNPNECTLPSASRNFARSSTTSANGKTILQEGSFQPAVMTFSGMIYDQEHLEQLTSFSQRKYLMLLTDDFEVERTIYIREFVPERKRALHSQSNWKHSYTMTVMVIEETGP